MEKLLAQISRIKDKELRELVISVLNLVPETFWTKPASSTYKYHPPISNVEGGLVNHTKLLVKFASELLTLPENEELNAFSDEIYVACILHDCLKYGWDSNSNFTVAEHPNLAADLIMQTALSNKYRNKTVLNRICNAVRSHTGKWNTDRNGNEILPTPMTRVEHFVHCCDFLASRSWLNVEEERLD